VRTPRICIHARERSVPLTIRQLTECLGDRTRSNTYPEFAAKSMHGRDRRPSNGAAGVFTSPDYRRAGTHLVGPDGVQRFVLAPVDSTSRARPTVMLDNSTLADGTVYTSPAVTNGWY